MTFSCSWCQKVYKTTGGLYRHLQGYHNLLASVARNMIGQQEGTADVDMEIDEAAMDESAEDGEDDGDDSDFEQVADDGISTGSTEPATRQLPDDAIGVAYTVCVVYAADLRKGLPEYMHKVDILFPTGTEMVKGIIKFIDGGGRAKPTHWVDSTNDLKLFTYSQRRDYNVLVNHRLRLNSPFPNRICATENCTAVISWRTAGVLKKKFNANKSNLTMAYLKSVRYCLQCSGL
ncbi:hypothetical protein BG015_008143 [Linnemannia schmuckeri]|uniref:C2H2-type domain-containing protein n=1 Tax=Linnemannia schmuckeri TaxID=64567 RepID=A0A9P5VEK6_9FUNG|nr:hypothetical protein BG015_008143 [Linnemannia schmuckeri]